MSTDKLTITIISDLHCKHSSSDKAGDISFSSTNLYSDILRTNNPPIHPVHALLQNINSNKEQFKSDLLLCPGDITDKVDAQGYITGWSFLEEFKEAMQAKKLFATIGNHDVDSRRKTPSELPFFISRSIKSNYPIEDQELQQKFWSNHFCVYECDEYALLIFNSCYSHISSGDAAKAKITETIIQEIEDELKKIDPQKTKIALCHHHPLNHSNTSYPDADVIDKGELLLDILCKYHFVMLIHGHKHEIKIRYYNSLLVFCAGSFSSQENLRETESDNVFHQIQVFKNNTGVIKTWVYGARSGWVHKSGKKFPATCGFGYKGVIKELAEKINSWFRNNSNSKLDKFSNLIAMIPEAQFLLPQEQMELETFLAEQYKIEITYSPNGIPVNISNIISDV